MAEHMRKSHDAAFKAKVAPELYRQIGRLKVELDWLKKNPSSFCRTKTGDD